jgi:hypothetical protein
MVLRLLTRDMRVTFDVDSGETNEIEVGSYEVEEVETEMIIIGNMAIALENERWTEPAVIVAFLGTTRALLLFPP